MKTFIMSFFNKAVSIEFSVTILIYKRITANKIAPRIAKIDNESTYIKSAG